MFGHGAGSGAGSALIAFGEILSADISDFILKFGIDYPGCDYQRHKYLSGVYASTS